MTGILRVSQNSMLSGLNNLEVFTVLNQSYASYFGFSEEEVHTLFSQCDLPHKTEEVRHYYNGYRIGDTMRYNPWSIIKCLKSQGRLEPYWVNTSDDSLLQTALLNSTMQAKTQLQTFFLEPDKKIEVAISETARLE